MKSEICETCLNNNSEICINCRYVEKNNDFFKPKTMNFVEAFEQLTRGKIITRDNKTFIRDAKTKFSINDYLSKEWRIFDEYCVISSNSELTGYRENIYELKEEVLQKNLLISRIYIFLSTKYPIVYDELTKELEDGDNNA